MRDLRFKSVMRRDPTTAMFRLLRVMWETTDPWIKPTDQRRERFHKLTLALRPALFHAAKDGYGDGWFLTVLGIRVHYQRSYGGRYA